MSYNILVVDDSAITRKVVKKGIAMTGLDVGEVHEARDGLEALQILDDKWIDLVFLDLNMPRMNGVELIAKMAEDHALERTPVIVVTSDRNELRLAELRALGVRVSVNKPFRPEALRDAINQAIGDVPAGGTHGS